MIIIDHIVKKLYFLSLFPNEQLFKNNFVLNFILFIFRISIKNTSTHYYNIILV